MVHEVSGDISDILFERHLEVVLQTRNRILQTFPSVQVFRTFHLVDQLLLLLRISALSSKLVFLSGEQVVVPAGISSVHIIELVS